MRFDHDGVQVRPARQEDIKAIADRLRPEDAAEVIATGFRDSAHCLEHGLSQSEETYTVVLRGIPVAMFGVLGQSLLGAQAVAWFLGTPEMSKIKKTFMKLSLVYVNRWLKRWPVIWNLVDTRYSKSIKWLRWCGARFGNPVSLNGVNFQLISFVRGG